VDSVAHAGAGAAAAAVQPPIGTEKWGDLMRKIESAEKAQKLEHSQQDRFHTPVDSTLEQHLVDFVRAARGTRVDCWYYRGRSVYFLNFSGSGRVPSEEVDETGDAWLSPMPNQLSLSDATPGVKLDEAATVTKYVYRPTASKHYLNANYNFQHVRKTEHEPLDNSEDKVDEKLYDGNSGERNSPSGTEAGDATLGSLEAVELQPVQKIRRAKKSKMKSEVVEILRSSSDAVGLLAASVLASIDDTHFARKLLARETKSTRMKILEKVVGAVKLSASRKNGESITLSATAPQRSGDAADSAEVAAVKLANMVHFIESFF